MARQYQIEARLPGNPRAMRYVNDRRGQAPRYASFDLRSFDEPHSVLPNMTMARKVRDDFIAWSKKYPSLGHPDRKLVLVPYEPPPVST